MAAIRDCGFELIDHLPYDLAPSNFHLFPNIKKHLVGKQYRKNDEVISAVEDFFTLQEENLNTSRIQSSTGGKCVWILKGNMLLNNK